MTARQISDSERSGPGSRPGPMEARQPVPLAEIEQAIERIGARYVADLRALSEEFSRFYSAQLAAKDESIAELSRRVETAERERDALAARIRQLQDISAKYVADLRAVIGEPGRHMEAPERERDISQAR